MVIVKLMGGLGNQMFQYAFGRHLASKTRSPLKLDLTYLLDRRPRPYLTFRDYDLSIFNVQENFATDADLVSFSLGGDVLSQLAKIMKLHHQKKYYIKEQLIKFYKDYCNFSGDIYIDGFWQSEEYFKDVESVIRSDFVFKAPLGNKARDLAQEIRATNAVSLNVRRGDYLASRAHRGFYYICDEDYYLRAMDKIAGMVKSPKFFIFSSEIKWCQDHLMSRYPVQLVSPEYAGEKFQDYLKLMALCKHYIIPNSTFAWWGAWLNPSRDKIVISPRQWIRQPWYWRRVYNDSITPANWSKL